MMTQRNNQVGGDHYAKQAIDPFTFAMANRWDPMMASILKYLSRYPNKGTPAQDLRKAAHIARYRCEFGDGWALDKMDLLDYMLKNNMRDNQASLFLTLYSAETYMRLGLPWRQKLWRQKLEALATACEAEACKYE